ncbi:MAG TPA: glucose 1-dehydrogenase [Pirellulales bacterium]|jgi:2-deoxy-D-gluconate 3-dehydrogenase|nr:glucose 1-dehydrogenase [Pirellulales bacterium]
MNLFDLTGKVAIVTGGGSGIGLGIAKGLSQAGARVVIVGRNEEKLQAAAHTLAEQASGEFRPLAADVADEQQVESVIGEVTNHFARIDILFNNAGINIRHPPQEMKIEEWRSVMDINLTSAFLMSKAVYPAMKQAGGGKIVNTGSMASLFGAAYAAPYAASKGGIVQLTKSLALAWAADNIQVNAILPGWFKTEMTDRARVEVPGLSERVSARIPAGRWAQPDDVAGTAIWLASRASDYVTGAAIPVDGGYSSVM